MAHTSSRIGVTLRYAFGPWLLRTPVAGFLDSIPSRARRLSVAFVVTLTAVALSPSIASATTITLITGTGPVGSLDPNVTVTDSCAGTPQQATIVAPWPAWTNPIGTSQWDSVNASYVGCNGIYQATFTLPPNAASPSLSVTTFADNSTNVSLNGNQPFIVGNVSGQCETDYAGSPLSGLTSTGFVAGVNTLTFDLNNCYPQDGENSNNPTGLDFVATVSYNLDPTSTTVSCLPQTITAGQSSTCTATVTDTAATGATSPTGLVSFTSNSASGSFGAAPGGPTCSLTAIDGNSASCQVTYTTSAGTSEKDAITASYPGDSNHNPSSGTATVQAGAGGGVVLHPPTVGNGSIGVSWSYNATSTPVPDSFTVTATPAPTDRVPAPLAGGVSVTRPGSATSATLSGLVEDCHQTYTISVTPVFAGVAGTPAVWPVLVRPSGNVIPGIPPQFVVVLLDGIGSQQAGFRMNPYQPTSVGPASYCPEGLNSSGRPLQRANPDGTLDGNAFAVAPHGPYEFFEKWNYYDAYDARNHNIPSKGSNSTPRDLATGRPTHSFLLDQLAATGAIILPYSYWGAKLESSTRFVYNAYSNCNSNPAPSVIVCNTDTEAVRMPGTGGADPGGSPDPSHRDVSNARHSFSVGDDIQRLEDEIASIHKVWRHVPIIVIGHSQGGLIAFDWWKRFWLSWGDSNSAGYGHTGVWKLFSLDSPINGACLGPTCLNTPDTPTTPTASTTVSRRGTVACPIPTTTTVCSMRTAAREIRLGSSAPLETASLCRKSLVGAPMGRRVEKTYSTNSCSTTRSVAPDFRHSRKANHAKRRNHPTTSANARSPARARNGWSRMHTSSRSSVPATSAT